MATRQEITKALLLMQFLPNSPITTDNREQVVNTFVVVLEDLPGEHVNAAAIQYLSAATFFPTPGQLRELALDLQMIALGLPSPAEAWAQVLGAQKYVQPVSCQRGAELRSAAEKATREYFWALNQYQEHLETCTICTAGGFQEIYGSPVVAECVRILGGRDALMTDNLAADRARFIEAYREIVQRERMKAGMLPQVKAYIAANRPLELQDGTAASIKQLAGRLSK